METDPMKRLLLAAAISAALIPGAFAQGNTANSASSETNSTAQNGQNAAQLPQEIKQKLSSAGYSDVKVMPSSFFVEAKDKQGDPVEILITPNSMMEVTALNTNEKNSVASNGQSNSNSSKNSD